MAKNQICVKNFKKKTTNIHQHIARKTPSVGAATQQNFRSLSKSLFSYITIFMKNKIYKCRGNQQKTKTKQVHNQSLKFERETRSLF